MTALRVMFPSSAAIWLADKPDSHNFFSCSTRSSVQVITVIAIFPWQCRAAELADRSDFNPLVRQNPPSVAGIPSKETGRYAKHNRTKEQSRRARCRV